MLFRSEEYLTNVEKELKETKDDSLNLNTTMRIIKKLSQIEFMISLWIAVKEGPEEEEKPKKEKKGKEDNRGKQKDKKKAEKKDESKEEKVEEKDSKEEDKKEDKKKPKEEQKEKKSKKKITHGKGTSKLISYLISLKFCEGEDWVKSFKNFNAVYDSKEFEEKIAEEMTSHNEAQRIPKLPKGTRDSEPLQMVIKNKCVEIIKTVFKKHGAMEIDTPAFELKETLMGKYGEESKLIYDLADQGGELLSLRYDLTVPFARYMALKKLTNFKRFHIGKVYRRETPQISKGRYREFHQCDYDIAGTCSLMIAEAEIFSIIAEVLKLLDVGDFSIIINHRGLLSAMIELAGCDITKFKTICSSIDKLDKSPWEEVRTELVGIKGLTNEQAEKLHFFTELRGKPKELLKRLNEEKQFGSHTEATEILKEMEILGNYLDVLGIEDSVFDLSLARGLDYYTGLIFEVKLKDPKYSVGSIAGGGRYDNLIGMFAGKQIPAIGFSFGIERLFTILEDRLQGKVKATSTKVLVSSIGKGMVEEKMKMCKGSKRVMR